MARYIDADALGIGKANREIFENKSYADGWNAAIDIISSAPTADLAEVVRCKDCKYYSEFGHCGILGFCEPNEFCSRGERIKENERL